MCSRNIFKKNECCRLVWAALSLWQCEEQYLPACSHALGCYPCLWACHVQQWYNNRAGSQAPCLLDQHGLSQLCSSVRPWQLAYAEMGVMINVGVWWGSDVLSTGMMLKLVLCGLEWNWCWPGSVSGEHNERVSFMVKSTSFWSWLALSFSSGFVTPVRPLASNNSKSQSW